MQSACFRINPKSSGGGGRAACGGGKAADGGGRAVGGGGEAASGASAGSRRWRGGVRLWGTPATRCTELHLLVSALQDLRNARLCAKSRSHQAMSAIC